MNRQQRPLSRRAGPLFGAFLVVAGAVGALTPVVPTTWAVDPEPTPTTAPEPTPEPVPTPTTAPEPTPEPVPTPTTDPEPTPEPVPTPTTDPEPTPEPVPSPGVTGPRVAHAWINTANEKGGVAEQGPLDGPLNSAARFTVYRVRFQLVNDADTDTEVEPVLQVAGGPLDWTTVPQVDPVPGQPFYGASDSGREFDARRIPIPVAGLRLAESADPLAHPVTGQSSAGQAMAAQNLPAHSFTEVEFAIRATVDAKWETRYRFRLVDGHEPLDGATTIELAVGRKSAVELSPGQRKGIRVDAPVPLYRLDPRIASIDMPLSDSASAASTVAYALRTPLAALTAPDTPHIQDGLASDACASCHGAHDAQSLMLLQQPGNQAATCFICHDGTGASSEVQSDWSNPSIPVNDSTTSSWYSHPATSSSNHESALDDEFGGVLDRHAACADCHQMHMSDGSPSVGSVGGWSSSGAIETVRSVSVTNGAAGTAPTYAWQKTSTFEYELCFKCHSGYTTLPTQDPSHPSRWALDKAIELNPANVSYHPIEAAGKNQTNAMARSLEGTSPYKLWRFTTDSTIRCQNCHGDSSLADPANPPDPGSSLDNHSSPNRGILIAPYRDRVLKARGPGYVAQDFALCYVCHAEAPMVDDSGDVRTDTNFSFHGYHLGAISGPGLGGTDIDVPGAGQGNAICAECHFRIHGTALAVNGQPPATGLVNFAPNVRALLSLGPMFRAATPTTMGSCTLDCHGKSHVNYGYDFPPTP